MGRGVQWEWKVGTSRCDVRGARTARRFVPTKTWRISEGRSVLARLLEMRRKARTLGQAREHGS